MQSNSRFPMGLRHGLDEDCPSRHPGVYAFFLRERAILPGCGQASDEPIYIGKCESAFEARRHFHCLDSSGSTFRRSLGALLRGAGELECEVHPREFRTRPTRPSFQNFRFSQEAEKKLTDWMFRNLEYSFEAIDGPIEPVEKLHIQEWNPPFNLQIGKHPFRICLLNLRKDCRAEARKRVYA